MHNAQKAADYAGHRNVWVFVETEGGAPVPVGLELLSPARRLADLQGVRLVAVIFGNDNAQAAQSAAELGADEVISVEGAEYGVYNTDIFTNALTRLVEKYKPDSLLFGATDLGCDFAPRVSCRLNAGLVAHCTALDIDEETGHVAWTRPAFGSRLMATILCPQSRPQMGTIRPGVFSRPARAAGRTCPVTVEQIAPPENAGRVRLLETVCDSAEAHKLEDAELVVGAGLGAGPKGLKLIEALADRLGAAVGVTRPMSEKGWADEARQIGQSGKSIHPKLYIACGISGASQHIAGIGGSDCVVAINNDPEAPIFSVADYGIVGDLFEVLPALTEALDHPKAGD